VVQQEGGSVQAEDVLIDLDAHSVSRGPDAITLTSTEWLLLAQLALRAGRTVSGHDLLAAVWGPEHARDLQYLRVWISRLRRKLEVNPARPALIKTMQGIGYMLEGERSS
jgi:two-component system KDP operon response regulator KdpE